MKRIGGKLGIIARLMLGEITYEQADKLLENSPSLKLPIDGVTTTETQVYAWATQGMDAFIENATKAGVAVKKAVTNPNTLLVCIDPDLKQFCSLHFDEDGHWMDSDVKLWK